jgi:glucuronosyltransferase
MDNLKIFLRKYFPSNNYVSYDEALRRLSLILLNQHFTQNGPRAMVPASLEVSGLHVSKPAPLPEPIRKWMDEAKHGVIFVCFGTNAKSSMFPKEKIDIFMKAFSTLKERVIFKWESDELDGKPDNVMIGKWLPQNDILAHKRTKLFISHAGMGSLVEAKNYGVPIMAIPIFGDQYMNAKSVVKENWGILVNFDNLQLETFIESLQEMLNNPK